MKGPQTRCDTPTGSFGPRRIALALLSACLVMMAGHAGAAPLTLPVNPLFVSTSINPNVMLLMDNSGSMNNIIWDDGFDPNTEYPNWANYSCSHSFRSGNPCWTAQDGSVILNQLTDSDNGDCNSGRVRGRSDGGTTRCLLLPDPIGSGDTRYSGNYLNYLFSTYANVTGDNGRDIRTLIPDEARIEVARNVGTNIVVANPDLRFGLSSFNAPVSGDSGPGGRIDAACGSAASTVLSQIANLGAIANTPLAETYYEITRYFRGLSRFSGSGSGNYSSPIQYRCQKNFVIAVTDGFPTWDRNLPTNDPADAADNTRSLPNWDGLAPSTQLSDFPNFPQYSDGFGPAATQTNAEAQTLYLDDLAKFGYDIDLRTSGTDLTGGSYQDPAFLQQNLITYTVGFAIQNQMLEDAAEYGEGTYYTASNASALTAALQAALTDIAARAGSFSSASLNSTSLNAGSRLFQASFNSANWTGQLTSTPISTGDDEGSCGDVDLGQLCAQQWNAASVLNGQNWNTGRNIFTYNPSTEAGIAFRWGQLDLAQQNALRLPSDADDTLRQPRLQYIRGNRDQESPTGFRVRGGVLGDIVNSDPFFVGAPNSALPFKGYSAFRSANAAREPMVYVGANDGMLHGFRASDGRELLAYVPNMMFGTSAAPKLARLTANPYTHVWGVNGSPNVADVDIGSESTPNWRSYLVSGMGYGAQGIFALDVTNPVDFSETNAASIVKWEFSDANDADMGNVMGTPSIVKMKNGKWAAIFGNGYNSGVSDGSASGTEQAALFIVFLDSPGGTWTPGTHYVKLLVGSPNDDNGLSGPAAVDLDGDSLVDYIYAGDIKGNLWQFNVNNEDPALWTVGYSSSPLFTARDAGGVAQPITAPPEVGFNLLTPDKDDLTVYVGTGRYVAAGDNTRIGQRTQSFYGIFANPIEAAGTPPTETTTSPNPGRGDLLQQFVEQEVNLPSGDQGRITSQNPLTIGTHKGWFIDLFNTNGNTAATGPNLGERQISRPIIRFGRIVFTTLVPSDDACDPDGSGWLMELDARDGGRPRKPALDITDDLIVDNDDIYDEGDADDPDDDINVSGIGSPQGILSTPAVLYVGREGVGEVKYSTRSDGSTLVIGEAASGRVGRVTWREIAP